MKTRRVLVIEDDIETARAFVLLLKREGHHAEYAINGYVAIVTACGLPLSRRSPRRMVGCDVHLGKPADPDKDPCTDTAVIRHAGSSLPSRKQVKFA
jgi:hypothetical protein